MLCTLKSKFSHVTHKIAKIQPQTVTFDNEELKELTPIKDVN